MLHWLLEGCSNTCGVVALGFRCVLRRSLYICLSAIPVDVACIHMNENKLCHKVKPRVLLSISNHCWQTNRALHIVIAVQTPHVISGNVHSMSQQWCGELCIGTLQMLVCVGIRGHPRCAAILQAPPLGFAIFIAVIGLGRVLVVTHRCGLGRASLHAFGFATCRGIDKRPGGDGANT